MGSLNHRSQPFAGNFRIQIKKKFAVNVNTLMHVINLIILMNYYYYFNVNYSCRHAKAVIGRILIVFALVFQQPTLGSFGNMLVHCIDFVNNLRHRLEISGRISRLYVSIFI